MNNKYVEQKAMVYSDQNSSWYDNDGKNGTNLQCVFGERHKS